MGLYWRESLRVLFEGLPAAEKTAEAPIVRSDSEPKEPEEAHVREVIGKAATVTLYMWARDTGKTEKKSLYEGLSEVWRLPTKFDYYDSKIFEKVYAHSCEQAHAEANGALVQAVECIRVGSSYFRAQQFESIKVLPKAKSCKGGVIWPPSQ